MPFPLAGNGVRYTWETGWKRYSIYIGTVPGSTYRTGWIISVQLYTALVASYVHGPATLRTR
eukprot:1706447-Prymnesium_polylepis.2